MTKEQIESRLKDKLPIIENLIKSGSMPISITKGDPGSLYITKDGYPLTLTDSQVKGLELYLSMILVINIDELKTKKA